MGIVARQAIFSSVSLVLGFAIGAVNSLIVLPWFEKSGDGEFYGLLQLIMSWAIVFGQILNLGAGSIAIRNAPRLRQEGNENQILFYAWLFPLYGILAFALFILSAGNWFFDTVTNEMIMDVSFLSVILLIHTIAITYFRSMVGIAFSQYKTVLASFLSEVFLRLVLLSGVVLYYYKIIDMNGLFWYFAFGHVLPLIVLFLTLGHVRLFNLKKPPKQEMREATLFGVYAIADSGANMLVNKIDVLMIGAMIGFSEINYYNFAFFAATIIMIPARSLVNISAPVVADSFHNQDWKNIQLLYQKNSLHQFLIGGIIFVMLWVGIDELVGYMPEKFADAKYAFLFLGFAKLFDLITSINGLILQVTPYYRYNFYFNVVLLTLVIITNWILIPIYGIIGASAATAACVLVYNILKTWFLYNKYKIQPFHSKTFVVILCLVVPLVIGYALPELSSNKLLAFFLKSGIVGIVFIPLVWFTRVSEDIRNLGFILLAKIGIKPSSESSVDSE